MSARRVPILTYHQVGRFPAEVVRRQRGNYVDARRFAAQMRLLRRLGYQAVPLASLAAWLAPGGETAARLPPRPVVLTFDDAYAGVFEHAAPVLAALDWPATTFAVTRRIGGDNTWDQTKGIAPAPLMDAPQLRELVRRGWEIGAHSRTHPRLPELDEEALKEEIAGSRDDLAVLLGAAPLSWCYPYGLHDERTVRAVETAGFRAAVTLRRGAARPGADARLLPRIHVGYRVGVTAFLWRLLRA